MGLTTPHFLHDGHSQYNFRPEKPQLTQRYFGRCSIWCSTSSFSMSKLSAEVGTFILSIYKPIRVLKPFMVGRWRNCSSKYAVFR